MFSDAGLEWTLNAKIKIVMNPIAFAVYSSTDQSRSGSIVLAT